jgi:hypothetical protein
LASDGVLAQPHKCVSTSHTAGAANVMYQSSKSSFLVLLADGLHTVKGQKTCWTQTQPHQGLHIDNLLWLILLISFLYCLPLGLIILRSDAERLTVEVMTSERPWKSQSLSPFISFVHESSLTARVFRVTAHTCHHFHCSSP